MVQCLAVVLLGLQMISTGSASGISARALLLDALAICCRLPSTLWLNGYLPVDASADYVFGGGSLLVEGSSAPALHQAICKSWWVVQPLGGAWGCAGAVLGAANVSP